MKSKKIDTLEKLETILSPALFREKILPMLQEIGKKHGKMKVNFYGGGSKEDNIGIGTGPSISWERKVLADVVVDGKLEKQEVQVKQIKYNAMELLYDNIPSPVQFFPYYQKTSDSIWARKTSITEASAPRRYLLLGLNEEYFEKGKSKEVKEIKKEIRTLVEEYKLSNHIEEDTSIDDIKESDDKEIIKLINEKMKRLEALYKRPDTGTLERYNKAPTQYGAIQSVETYLLSN